MTDEQTVVEPIFEVPAHLRSQGGELRGFKFQSLLQAPDNISEAGFYYDGVAHRPKFHNGTGITDFGKEYSNGTGINVDNINETISVIDYDKLLKNLASYDSSIAIGNNSYFNSSINIGKLSESGAGGVSIGYNAKSANAGVAIGETSDAHNFSCIAIGSRAKTGVGLSYTYQIGSGTNSTEKTLAIGFGTDANNQPLQYTLLDGTTGLMPDERISSNIARKSDVIKAFNPSGSVGSASELPTLSANVLGNIYRVTTAFDTTSDFVEGAGHEIQIGNDIVVVNIGTDENPTYKFNVWGDFIDLSGKQDVISDLSTIRSNAQAGKNASDTIETYGDIVSRNAGEFATASQGAKADTACQKIAVYNTALTESNNICTWIIPNTLETDDVTVNIYEVNNGVRTVIYPPYTVTNSLITINMLSDSDIDANTLRAVITG